MISKGVTCPRHALCPPHFCPAPNQSELARWRLKWTAFGCSATCQNPGVQGQLNTALLAKRSRAKGSKHTGTHTRSHIAYSLCALRLCSGFCWGCVSVWVCVWFVQIFVFAPFICLAFYLYFCCIFYLHSARNNTLAFQFNSTEILFNLFQMRQNAIKECLKTISLENKSKNVNERPFNNLKCL